MRHHQSSSLWETSTHTHTHTPAHTHTHTLTADDCPWFRCFSEAENLAQRHAPFHIHNVVFKGSKSERESRRSSVQRRGDGLTAAPLNQPVSYKYTAPTAVTLSAKHVAIQPGCCTLRTASTVGSHPQQKKDAQERSQSAASKRVCLDVLSSPLVSWVYLGARGRTDKTTCYFPIAD